MQPKFIPLDPVMPALNPTTVTYIAEIVNKQVHQQEREVEVTVLLLNHIPAGLILYSFLHSQLKNVRF